MKNNIQLNNNLEIPALGFGTWQIKGDDARRSVLDALELGYRHIDTADVYGNHKEVGKGIHESGIPRDEIFLTTKVWRDHLDHDGILDSARRFQDELEVDYFDLLLVHWPNENFPIKRTLEGLRDLQDKKITKSIGVSNFTIPLLEEAIKTGIKFQLNQVEFHPSLNQKDLVEFCHKNKIIPTAYSPIAQGADLKIPVIMELAKIYEKTPSQIVLNWIMKKNIVVIPRSSNKEHAKDNLGALSFELSNEDCAKIDELKLHNRIVRPPFAPFED